MPLSGEYKKAFANIQLHCEVTESEVGHKQAKDRCHHYQHIGLIEISK